jgi:hypothetical protein
MSDKLSMNTVNELSNKYLPTLNESAEGQQHEFFVVCGIALYTVFIAPKLNKRVIDILDHPASRLILLAMILLFSRKSTTIALFMTIAILVTYSSAGKELMTNVNGPVKGNCKCVSWECDNADGNTMSFDSDMDENEGMLPGHDASTVMHHPASPEELLHAQESAPEIAPEDHTVQVIVEEKAKMEEQLQRELTQEELQTLCADVSNAMPAQTSSPIESFSDIVGFNGSAYASA